MTDLLHILRLARERGAVGKEQRLQLMAHYPHAFVIFCEALGEEFNHMGSPVAITTAQLDAIEKAVEMAYADRLAVHRLREAFRKCGAEYAAFCERALKSLRRGRLKG